MIIIQEIIILVYCIYLQIVDYNTKNKYPKPLYIPENRDYNTRNKYSSLLYIPDILDYNTISCTHMRDNLM